MLLIRELELHQMVISRIIPESESFAYQSDWILFYELVFKAGEFTFTPSTPFNSHTEVSQFTINGFFYFRGLKSLPLSVQGSSYL